MSGYQKCVRVSVAPVVDQFCVPNGIMIVDALSSKVSHAPGSAAAQAMYSLESRGIDKSRILSMILMRLI